MPEWAFWTFASGAIWLLLAINEKLGKIWYVLRKIRDVLQDEVNERDQEREAPLADIDDQ